MKRKVKCSLILYLDGHLFIYDGIINFKLLIKKDGPTEREVLDAVNLRYMPEHTIKEFALVNLSQGQAKKIDFVRHHWKEMKKCQTLL